MALVLEGPHALQRDRAADVDVGRRDVDPELHAQRPAEARASPRARPAGRTSTAFRVSSASPWAPIVRRLERVARERPGRGRVPDAEGQARDARAPARCRSNARRTRRARSVSPKPVVSEVIETAVKKAKIASAATATARESIVATSSTPTPALPPRPWTRPMPNAASGVRRSCECAVRVLVEAKLAAPPAGEQPQREVDDQPRDRRLRATLDASRAAPARRADDRQAEHEERQRVPEAPGHAEPRGASGRALAPAGEERRDGDDVVRVGRMPQAEEDRHDGDEPEGHAVGIAGDQSSSPNIRTPPGVRGRSWPGRAR